MARTWGTVQNAENDERKRKTVENLEVGAVLGCCSCCSCWWCCCLLLRKTRFRMYKNTEDHRRQKKRQNKDGRIEFSLRKNNNTKKNGKERDGRRKRRGQKDGSDILFCLLCFTFFLRHTPNWERATDTDEIRRNSLAAHSINWTFWPSLFFPSNFRKSQPKMFILFSLSLRLSLCSIYGNSIGWDRHPNKNTFSWLNTSKSKRRSIRDQNKIDSPLLDWLERVLAKKKEIVLWNLQ